MRKMSQSRLSSNLSSYKVQGRSNLKYLKDLTIIVICLSLICWLRNSTCKKTFNDVDIIWVLIKI